MPTTITVTAKLYASFIAAFGSDTISLDTDQLYVALVTDSYVPNTATDTYWSTPQAHEPSGSGYTAGGIQLTGTSWSGTVYSCTSPSWGALSLSNVRYLVIYDKTSGTGPSSYLLVGYIDLGSAQTLSGQPLAVTLPGGVLLTLLSGAPNQEGYLGPVDSQSEMDAITGNVGDYVFRNDLGIYYFRMPAGAPPAWSGLTVPIPASQLSSTVQTNLAQAAAALPASSVVNNNDGTLSIGGVSTLEPLSTTAIYSNNTSPPIGQTSYYNASGGNRNPTLPALSGVNVGARLDIRRDPADTSNNIVTVTCAGSDTFYSSGATSTTFPISGEQREFQVISVAGVKYWAPAGSVNPVSGNDERYLSSFCAADYGWGGWSHDIAACASSGAIPTAGVVCLVRLPLRVKQTITNIILGINVAGASLTSGENFAGLYQNGNLLASTADQSTAWQSTGIKTMALSSPQLVDPANGAVYAAFFANGTTRPTFVQAAIAASMIFLAPAFVRYADDTTHTGRTTTFSSTLGTLAATSPFWAAWS